MLAPILGGLMIGVAVAALLLLDGKLAGISGIVAGLVGPRAEARDWRVAFLAGLLVTALIAARVKPELFGTSPRASLPAMAIAGVLIGAGSRLGRGCTSGHGICGIARLSSRSIAATITFMATGALTVLAVRLLGAAR